MLPVSGHHVADVIGEELPYSPAEQFVHTPAPARLYVPDGHCSCVALIEPAGHA